MSHTIQIQVTAIITVEVERVEGKFAPRSDYTEAIVEALREGAEDLGDFANEAAIDGIGSDGDSVYEVTSVSVDSTDAFEVPTR